MNAIVGKLAEQKWMKEQLEHDNDELKQRINEFKQKCERLEQKIQDSTSSIENQEINLAAARKQIENKQAEFTYTKLQWSQASAKTNLNQELNKGLQRKKARVESVTQEIIAKKDAYKKSSMEAVDQISILKDNIKAKKSLIGILERRQKKKVRIESNNSDNEQLDQ